jgi:nucleotide-binding universal stress UspA family protein
VDHPVVVGVDGSDSSLEAVDWAVDEAARHGRALRIVHGSRWGRYDGFGRGTGRPESRIVADNVVAAAEQRAVQRRPETKVSGQVVPNDPVDALVEEGRSAFALVVGSRGLGTLIGMLLGSVSLEVAGRAACPTVVVRGAEPNRRGDFGRVVLGVGEESAGSAAVAFAFHETGVRGGELRAVHAWRLPGDAPDGVVERARAEDVLSGALSAPETTHGEIRVRREALEGSPRHVLLEAAASADLLIVGARGRRGLVSLELGPVNHAVLHHAPCPVAVVPRT